MADAQPPGAFPGSLLASVASRLDLAYAPWMQDWPVEVVSRGDLERVLQHYERHREVLSPEERKVIVHVLLACLDEHLEGADDRLLENLAARIFDVIRRERNLCDSGLRYWFEIYWSDNIAPEIEALRKAWALNG